MKIKKKKIEKLIKKYEEEYDRTRGKIMYLDIQIKNYEPRYGPRDVIRMSLEKEWRTMNNLICILQDLKALVKED